MMDEPEATERVVTRRIAEELERNGFEVTLEPSPNSVPFNLGGYQPDIVAKKSDVGLIIEVKRSERDTSLDRYAEVAARVREHPGWRFLLVPADRFKEIRSIATLALPDWPDLIQAAEAANELVERRMYQAAFLTVWSALEGLLRRVSEEQAIPAGALSPASLLKHLFSFGVLSRRQFAALEELLQIRNATVHGFSVPGGRGPAQILFTVYLELLAKWAPSPNKAESR
jgi:hypothetical protein